MKHKSIYLGEVKEAINTTYWKKEKSTGGGLFRSLKEKK